MPGDSQGFSELLRAWRVAGGLTQEQLADRSGLGVRTIRDLEQGRVARPRSMSVGLLAAALDLPPGDRDRLARAARQQPALPQPGLPQPGLPPPGVAAGRPGAPRQLPPAVRHFTGRADALKILNGLVYGDAMTGRMVVIAAIGGTAGVGKTALAVHWAHQAADCFPDGQLYVNLRGFDPSGTPVSPEAAVRGFLDGLAVPAERVPVGLEAQTALYRTLLAGRRMLILLDNARDAAQVRPLLPGSGESLVVVTSRDQLAGLAVAEGACQISLNVLTAGEASDLLADRLGAGRLAGEPGAAAELIELCARLPLALAVAAARLAPSAEVPLATLVTELRAATERLDVLAAGDAATDVRAVFSWSYQQLSPAAAGMFRLLGVHPGPDISLLAAASLAGLAPAPARAALRELAAVHLLSEQASGRFAVHDLLRSYAAEQAADCDSGTGRQAALHRILDHYLQASYRAAGLFHPALGTIELAGPPPGVQPEQITSYQHAAAWFEAEHRVLLAAVPAAIAAGFDTYAWQIPWALAPYLQFGGYWAEFLGLQRAALAAAQRLADPLAEARAHYLVALAAGLPGDYAQARIHMSRSLALREQLGDMVGQTRCHTGLGWLAERQGDYTRSLEHYQDGLRVAETAGRPADLSQALNAVGWCHALLGDYSQTLAYSQRSLALAQQADDTGAQAAILDTIGYAQHQLGHHAEAIVSLEQAVAFMRRRGGRHELTTVLDHLGDACAATGDLDRAKDSWQQSLDILTALGHPDADRARAKIQALDQAG
jgi:tetratricopeptide (TPR) repeat protein